MEFYKPGIYHSEKRTYQNLREKKTPNVTTVIVWTVDCAPPPEHASKDYSLETKWLDKLKTKPGLDNIIVFK